MSNDKQIEKHIELPHQETIVGINTIQTKPFDNQKTETMSNDKQSSSVMNKNIVIVDAEVLTSVQYDLNDLAKLFEDVIMDLHNVKGCQQLRHSFILYRDMVDAIKDKLKECKSNETD